MTTRRDVIKTLAAASLATAIVGVPDAMATNTQLTWKHFPAGEHGFFRAPVLISGARDAVLIDAGFTLPDGKALAEAIKSSGKRLNTIYISQSDPDYYFSLAPITTAFPEAKVIAASSTIAAIKGNVEKKLSTWGPQLKENGPRALADIVMPEAFEGRTLTVEGHTIEIVDADGLANRRYVWVPSLNGIFGGVLVFSGVHVWTADTQSAEARAGWVKTLDAMIARKPAVVIPGHMAPSAAIDAAAIHYTRDYLVAFEEELVKAANSAGDEAMTTNIDIVRAHYAASAQGNIDEMMADISPQVCWTEMAGFPCAGTWIEPQAVVDNVFAVLGRDWSGYRFELQSLIDGGHQIVGVGTYHGIYRATGKEMQARVAHVWRLQDGKVVAFEQFTDTLLVDRAMR